MKICLIGNEGHSSQAVAEMRECPEATFVGIAPGSPYENSATLTRYGFPLYEDYEEMLDTVKPDIAIVSPVFGRTGKAILACAARGIDVFAEKPIASTLQELEQIREAVARSGIRLSAMHYLRYEPSFYQACRVVREGRIGTPRLLNARKSYKFGTRPDWYRDRALYTGTIPWVGIHAIDWLYCFSGEKFVSVNALASGNPEMTAVMQYRMTNDVFATATLDYYRPTGAKGHGDDRLRVVGTKGIIEVTCKGYVVSDNEGVTEVCPEDAPKLAYEFLMGKEAVPAEEAMYLTEVALRSRESADTGGEMKL